MTENAAFQQMVREMPAEAFPAAIKMFRNGEMDTFTFKAIFAEVCRRDPSMIDFMTRAAAATRSV